MVQVSQAFGWSTHTLAEWGASPPDNHCTHPVPHNQTPCCARDPFPSYASQAMPPPPSCLLPRTWRMVLISSRVR
jgi:hypothetical protein